MLHDGQKVEILINGNRVVVHNPVYKLIIGEKLEDNQVIISMQLDENGTSLTLGDEL